MLFQMPGVFDDHDAISCMLQGLPVCLSTHLIVSPSYSWTSRVISLNSSCSLLMALARLWLGTVAILFLCVWNREFEGWHAWVASTSRLVLRQVAIYLMKLRFVHIPLLHPLMHSFFPGRSRSQLRETIVIESMSSRNRILSRNNFLLYTDSRRLEESGMDMPKIQTKMSEGIRLMPHLSPSPRVWKNLSKI